MLEQITPLLLTLNEAPNIARTLAKLDWAKEIVVVDSGSSDTTRSILAQHARVRVIERAFTNHTEQWTFGLEQTGIGTDWVLALDADYVLSDGLVKEIAALQPTREVGGYQAGITYCIEGKPLRGSAYPPVVVLYRRAVAHYAHDAHTQRIEVSGEIRRLQSPVFHDDRKPLSRWVVSQVGYMRLEARKLLDTPTAHLGWADRLRKLVVFAPVAMVVYCLLVRGGLLDGKAGIYYAMQRGVAESILSLYLLQAHLGIDLE